MSESITERKRSLRHGIRSARAARTAADRRADAESLTLHLAELTRASGADRVACYLSSPTEPDTRGYLAWARDHGVRVLLPVSRSDGTLDWVAPEYESGRMRETVGLHGVPEPLGPAQGADALGETALLIVPAAAADTSGARLGWGKGYYDRALAGLARPRPIYAVVFADEVLPAVPREGHDRPVSGIVTPEGIIQASPFAP